MKDFMVLIPAQTPVPPVSWLFRRVGAWMRRDRWLFPFPTLLVLGERCGGEQREDCIKLEISQATN